LFAWLLLFCFWPIIKRCSLDPNERRKIHFVWSFERFKNSRSASGKVVVVYFRWIPKDKDILPNFAFSYLPSWCLTNYLNLTTSISPFFSFLLVLPLHFSSTTKGGSNPLLDQKTCMYTNLNPCLSEGASPPPLLSFIETWYRGEGVRKVL
jgi:hypothetical protein